MLTEKQILNQIHAELELGKWHEDLIDQSSDPKNPFHAEIAERALPRTEYIAAQAISNKLANYLSYVPATKVWYLWDGRIHRPCTGDGIAKKVLQRYFKASTEALEYIEEAIDGLAKKMQTSGEDNADEKARKIHSSYGWRFGKHRKFRDRLATDAGQRAVMEQLKVLADVSDDHFIADTSYLVVRNGVIDLEAYKSTGTLELLPHDPARAVYRFFDADYDPAVGLDGYPEWRRFLASSIVDWDTACLLQKFVGAAYSAESKPRALANLLGAPASGKSVFLSVFNRLGQGYSVMPNNQAIQQNSGDNNPYQDDMKGARFIGFSEVQGKKALDDGFIKKMMGGDQQKTRKLYSNGDSWKGQGVMFIASNMALKINTRDDATFGKILPIPFPHSFTDTDPEHQMDRDLEEKVLAERNGILHWILQGMALYWNEGLHPTAAVMAAMDDNKTANSHSLQFIESMLAEGFIMQNPAATLSHCLPLKEAYIIFNLWALEYGIKNVPGKQTFSDDIAGHFHGKQKSGGWIFIGLEMEPHFRQRVANPLGYQKVVNSL